jgi:hypothetical protein
VERAHRISFALVALAALWTSAPALAEPTAAEVAVARRAFAEATALEKEKKWAEAEGKLREAVAIKETPGLRYHLGFCLEHQGKLVEALVEYDRADEMLRLGTKAPDVEALVGPARDGVKKRVATVKIRLGQAASGAVVELDGVPLKALLLGKAVPQNPGSRVVTASAPGRQPFRKEVRLGEGEVREIVVDLLAKAPAASPSAPAAPAPSESGDADAGGSAGSVTLDAAKPSSTRTIVLIAEAAVTGVALGSGIYFTLAKGRSDEDIDAANAELDARGYDESVCGGTPPDDAKNACTQLGDLVDQRDQQKTLALVGFVGAGVGAAATVATFLLWKPTRSAPSASLRVVPAFSPRGGGVAVGGRF